MTDAEVPTRGGASRAPALSAADIVRSTGGRLLRSSERPVRGAAVDSRVVEPGNLFVALAGERTDGHRFLADAVAAGAAALVVSRPIESPDTLGEVTIVRVVDPLAALHAIAAEWRTRFQPLVVGVTGSVAKTSVKEAVATVLGGRFTTLRNEGNQNNEIGLPLTVLRLGPEHQAAVLEMGMYVGGEIAELARIARPRFGVVTAVLGVHLSRTGSIRAIEQAKGELVEALPADGLAILNADDARVRRMAGRTRAPSTTYGFADDADVRAERVESAAAAGMRFILRAAGTRRPVEIPVLGRHAVHNALAAAAAGLGAGMTIEAVVDRLRLGWAAPHRSELVRAGGLTILDDTYNAAPASMLAALDVLALLPGRRIAVLGEMLELGDEHEDGHRRVGAAAAGVVDRLVVVGDGAGLIAEAALAAGLPAGRVTRVPDREAALDGLRTRLQPGDVVLVKASRGAALDLLVDALRSELGSSEAGS